MNSVNNQPKSKDVTNAILGLIKACDPVTFDDLLYECKIQVINFENINDFQASGMIDDSLNSLLSKENIILESSYSEENHKYDIVFRQA